MTQPISSTMLIAQAKRAYELGVKQVWLPQQQNYDAISLAALVGAAVPGLGVGTSVAKPRP
jgi:alkanesulfonate monooxygenase SsuD/methylene tetrahydromethanopterin reductase-like flavin-dependent oxidoreductase (luciferase family)